MFLNERMKSKELIYYEALSQRSVLSEDERRKLERLRKGYAGEIGYDRMLDEAGHAGLLIYRDLWLRIGEATLQIDSLIIGEHVMVVNEIKNYSGRYAVDGGRWLLKGRQISEDPIAQASRTAGKLLRLKKFIPYHFTVDKRAVFVNPDFHLVSCSGESGQFIVVRTLLTEYFRELGRMSVGKNAHDLTETIKAFVIDNPIALPVIHPSLIWGGSYCFKCSRYELVKRRFSIICRNCGYVETVERLVVRGMIDFSVLHHTVPMTKERLCKFIGGMAAERTIRALLKKYCVMTAASQKTYYVIKNYHLEKLLRTNHYDSKYEKDERFIWASGDADA
ncbi:nuclease-related domain-containing protein [Salinicoccus albus]|uniref:nuclease-related domain-containing protein n=1 Tax=Salinicoccus albus TaxID=418756 RepID=UPI0003726489|nr:nuclease-related domain-containing protein [Salinicoccus albus]